MRIKMIRKIFFFTLLSIFSSLSVFGDENNSYNIYIKNRETGKIIELTGYEKEVLKKCIDNFDNKKAKLRKAPIEYIIIFKFDDECLHYKVSGLYIAKNENDLYIKCSEVMDIIVKTGI